MKAIGSALQTTIALAAIVGVPGYLIYYLVKKSQEPKPT